MTTLHDAAKVMAGTVPAVAVYAGAVKVWPLKPPAEWRGQFYGVTAPDQIGGDSQLGVNNTGNPTTLWITPVDANGVDQRAWLMGLGAGAALNFKAGSASATATLSAGPTDLGTHLEFAGLAWSGTAPWQFPAGNVQIT